MSRPRPTFADYIVIAISPILIMALVGSLVFFLLEAFYQGQFEARLKFIMAMFVMAAVLIGRISIEEGREYAALFAIPLGLVTAAAMFRFVQFEGPMATFSPAINIGLLGLIWWATDRLTWDCTVLDESEDASGEGLLQTVGLDEDSAEAVSETDAAQPSASPTPTPGSLWQRFIKSRRRPHAHGVWVVYFSLAALPIFGFGQWFLPGDDLVGRRYVFKLLVVYVGAALGLLLTTSFLGMRRYLRQRRLEMPVEMAGTWMGVGATMVVALLLFCMLLPRRNAEYSVTHLPAFAGSRDDLWTSRWGVGRDGPVKKDADRTANRQVENSDDQQGNSQGKSQGKSSGKNGSKSGDGKSRSQGKSASGDKSQGKSSGQSDQQSSGKSSSQSKNGDSSKSGSQNNSQSGENSDQKSSGREGEQQNNQNQTRSSDDPSRDGQSGGEKQGQDGKKDGQKQDGDSPPDSDQDSSSQSSPSRSAFNPTRLMQKLGAGFGGLLKLLYWLAVFAIVGFLLWRYHEQIARALREFMRALQDLWQRLFGGRAEAVTSEETEEARASEPPPRPFADFPNPFSTGQASQWSADELVRYSFEAFEAWARERGHPRDPDQTPAEFARRVSLQERGLGKDALRLAELYNVTAYGQRRAPPECATPLQRLWRNLVNV